MAFPWIAESNFEQGTNAEWVAEVDTGNLLDFPHFTRLAAHNGSNMAPFSGAYCMRVQAGDANNHFVRRTDAIVPIASSGFFKFMFMVGSGWRTAGTTNTFTIFRLQGIATTTVIASVGLRAGRSTDVSVVDLGIGNSVPTVFAASPLELDRWYTIEVQASSAADLTTGAVGVNTLYLDGAAVASVAGGQQTVAASVVWLGVMDNVAANVGTLLFDEYVHDDLRIGPSSDRSNMGHGGSRMLTASGHLFVGPGTLHSATLIAGAAANNVATIYDTNQAGVTSLSNVKAVLQNTVSSEVIDVSYAPITFTRGCYVVLTGTNPRLSAVYDAYAETSFEAKKQYGSTLKIKPWDAI